MARFAALFCAVVAAATSAAAAAVQERDSALITFFTDSTQIAVSQLVLAKPTVRLVGLQRPDRQWRPVHLVELNGNVPNFVNLEFNDLFLSPDPFGERLTISTLRSVASFALGQKPLRTEERWKRLIKSQSQRDQWNDMA
ncbi:hypothetical protein B0H14DRAFT_2652142 [Mycena olivaceomarginata]|nr:hypothetical protein B0H14DRAFT_2652142 [Mycena olivaceomarginata]